MEVNIAEQGKWERIVEVAVPNEELVPKFNETYATYKKSLQLEGFRKGKVPVDLIKKLFGTKIEKEVAEKSIPDFLEEVVKQHHVKLYDVSKIEKWDYSREAGLSFKAIIKIEPEVVLDKYKDLKIEREIYQISDEDLNEAIDHLREQHATMTTIDGEAQRGHYIVADIQQVDLSGVPLVGHKYENRYFQLGGEQADEEFITQLLGIKSGESRRIRLHAPNPDGGEAKDEYFSVTIKEVKEKKLPELDDEFAKDVGNFKDLEDLTKGIRLALENQAEEDTRQKLDNRVVDEVIKNNPIDLPDFMIDNFLNAFVDNIKKENPKEVDEKEVRDRYRADAIWGLKWRMIKDKISELEKIEVAETEINDYIETLAKRSGKNAPVVRSNYRNAKKRDQLRYQIQEKKVIDLLLQNAQISENTTTFQDRKKAQELVV
ncbi:trigger factor [candidate division KSB1 bacterium]|nr:trigger factor [candidate division KSB1 bacterium]